LNATKILGEPDKKKGIMADIIIVFFLALFFFSSLIIFGVLQANIDLALSVIVFIFLFILRIFLAILRRYKKSKNATKWTTLIHEYCHKIMANKLGYNAQVITNEKKLEVIKAKTGIDLNGYCKFSNNEEFKKRDFIIISLAPFLFFIFMFILLQCIQYFIAWILVKVIISIISYMLIFRIEGCSNDIQMVIETRRVSENNKIMYSANRYRFVVYEKY